MLIVLLVLLAFIFFLAFPIGIIGLIKPRLLRLLFRKVPTRKLVTLSFIGTVVISFALMTTIVEADKKDFPDTSTAVVKATPIPTKIVQKPKATPTPAPTKKVQKPSPTPTYAPKPTVKPTIVPKKQVVGPTKAPTPTMDCSQSAYPQACIQEEIAQEPKLNATVDFSDYGIVITNNDSVDWTLCDITIGADVDLNNAYELGGWSNTFPALQTVTVPWANIVQDNGNRFDYATTKPEDVDIDCSVNKQDEHLRIN